MRRPKMHVIKPSDTGKTLCGKSTTSCESQGWFRGRARVARIATRRGLDMCSVCVRNASAHCESFSDRKLWPDEDRRA